MACRQSVFEYLKECALRPDATRESVLAEIERTTSSEFNYLAVGSRVRMAVLRRARQAGGLRGSATCTAIP